MTDRYEIPLETTEGQRGPGSFGDRLIVGVAIIALLGGVFIVAGKVFTRGDGVAASSPTARPSGARQSRQPTPAPAPQVMTVQGVAVPAAPTPQPPGFNGWIRALVDLPVVEAPVSGANQVGAMARGDVAQVSQVPSAVPDGITWLQLQSGTMGGSVIAARRGTKDYVRRYAQPADPYGASVNGLVAGPDRFVAFGSTADLPGAPSRPFLLVSQDGQRWDRVDLAPFGGNAVDGVALGPAGWLAVSGVQGSEGPSRSFLWSSPDAVHWRPLGMMSGLGDDLHVDRLIGTPTGYEVSVFQGRGEGQQAWHSSDGLTWTRADPFAQNGYFQIIGAGAGYFAWSQDPGPGSHAAFTGDGLLWSEVVNRPTGNPSQIVSLDDGLLAIDRSPVTGFPRVWKGSVAGDTLKWTQELDQDAFRDAGVSALASDGTRAIAVGWEASSLKPMVWLKNGPTWERVPVGSDTFGGAFPMTVAVNAQAAVAVGSRVSLQADNPTLWRAATGTNWSAVAVPTLVAVGNATATNCPTRPREILEFLVLPGPKAIACYGRTPITFRAYSALCAECAGPQPGIFDPAWLVGPSTSQLNISPIQGTDWWMTVRIAPTLTIDPKWSDEWLELTGHFDDPASTSCRYAPDSQSGDFPWTIASAVASCRQTFVVTKVRVVSGA